QEAVGASYSRQSQPVPGTPQTASIDFTGGSASNVLSWSFTNDSRWSLGMLLSSEKSPQANYAFRANGSMGVEFDLVPLQTVNRGNFGMRGAIGPELQRYAATNVGGLDRQIVGRQFCDVFLSWHFVPVDLWVGVGESTVLKDFAYRSLTAGVSATWRI